MKIVLCNSNLGATKITLLFYSQDGYRSFGLQGTLDCPSQFIMIDQPRFKSLTTP